MLGDRETYHGCKAFARAALTRYQLSREEREQELESLTQALFQVLTDALENLEHRRIGGDGHV
jgi:sugar (pentulose or hexulose) kinase